MNVTELSTHQYLVLQGFAISVTMLFVYLVNTGLFCLLNKEMLVQLLLASSKQKTCLDKNSLFFFFLCVCVLFFVIVFCMYLTSNNCAVTT